MQINPTKLAAAMELKQAGVSRRLGLPPTMEEAKLPAALASAEGGTGGLGHQGKPRLPATLAAAEGVAGGLGVQGVWPA